MFGRFLDQFLHSCQMKQIMGNKSGAGQRTQCDRPITLWQIDLLKYLFSNWLNCFVMKDENEKDQRLHFDVIQGLYSSRATEWEQSVNLWSSSHLCSWAMGCKCALMIMDTKGRSWCPSIFGQQKWVDVSQTSIMKQSLWRVMDMSNWEEAEWKTADMIERCYLSATSFSSSGKRLKEVLGKHKGLGWNSNLDKGQALTGWRQYCT